MSALTSAVLVGLGAFFLVVGGVGLVRQPDTLSRLQGVFKGCFLGMGFLMLGLLLRVGFAFAALKLLCVWALFLVALWHLGQLVGHRALRDRGDGIGAGPLSPGQRPLPSRKRPGPGPWAR